MTDPRPRDDRATDTLREAAVDALAEAFAEDALGLEEFERRVELAHRAETAGELRFLLEDLPGARNLLVGRDGAGPIAETVPRDASLTPAPDPGGREMATPGREQAAIVGFLGAGVRRGRWHPARYNYAVAVLGGADLDFRDCPLPPVTDVRCFAVMGGVEIIVPPDVVVQSSGLGILGGFEHRGGTESPPPGAPVIRITGLAVMGGVHVQVRYPGETAAESKRRVREERREKRRLNRGS